MLERFPDQAALSVVTLAELELGVHLAQSDGARARRLKTLQAVRATYVALPVTEPVAGAFAELVATARRTGRRPRIQDTWIAATARSQDVPVFTQDHDFDDLAVEVVHV